jgi:hypothetical protein
MSWLEGTGYRHQFEGLDPLHPTPIRNPEFWASEAQIQHQCIPQLTESGSPGGAVEPDSWNSIYHMPHGSRSSVSGSYSTLTATVAA